MKIEETIEPRVYLNASEMESEINRYQSLLNNLKDMVNQKDRGFNVADEMNKEFWNYLDAHTERLEEQVRNLKTTKPEKWNETLSSSNSIYEAAREWQMKYSEPLQ